MLALSVAIGVASCANNDNPADLSGMGYRSSLFVATDRHESGKGNNLTAMLKQAVAGSEVRPQTVLLGGDYVGGGGDRTPAFSIDDLYAEVYAVMDPHSTYVMMTYGSHDNCCTEGYRAFYSGPRHCDNYYTYGISFIQMVYATDSAATAAIRYFDEHGSEQSDPIGPSLSEENGSETAPPPPPDDNGEGGGDNPDGGGRKPADKGYNGIDKDDRYGISAESAARSFTEWVATIADHDPIVVMTHVPLHANRKDNIGALTWYEALTAAARTHDLLVLWGHNHTMEEHGNDSDQYSYLFTVGDSLDVQGDSTVGVVRRPLNFTYANAGYLKLGRATVVTFFGPHPYAPYERMELRRYSLEGETQDPSFGLTGKPNPYVITLTQSKR